MKTAVQGNVSSSSDSIGSTQFTVNTVVNVSDGEMTIDNAITDIDDGSAISRILGHEVAPSDGAVTEAKLGSDVKAMFDKKADKLTEDDGFVGGFQASAESGAALGYRASAVTGGAIGENTIRVAVKTERTERDVGRY